MSKISEQAAYKFIREDNFSQGNTKVKCTNYGVTMRLHGNLIASRDEYGLILYTQGWLTRTTKDRLNSILSQCGFGVIVQRKGKWYYKDYRTGRDFQFEVMLTFDRIRTPEGNIGYLLVPQASH